jgi:membrane fusion protein, multidrug efflux system
MTVKRKTMVIAAIAVVVLAVGAVAGSKMMAAKPAPEKKADGSGKDGDGKAAAVPEFVPTELVKVARTALPLQVTATGTLMAERSATVRSKVAAVVSDVLVREGEAVAAGQVVARLDASELQQRAVSQEGLLASAQARLASAQRTRDTQRALLNHQFISQTEVKSAQAQLAIARQALGDAVVRAPVAGIVAKRHVNPGERVNFDGAIVQVVDLVSLELQAWVPPQVVGQLKPGQPVLLQADGIAGSVKGEVKRVLPAADPGTRQIGVVVGVPNASRVLKVGMQATADITLSSREVLTAASVALANNNGDFTVWRVNDGKAQRLPVKVGQRDDARGIAEIADAQNTLKAGDLLLAGRYDALRDGQDVKLVQTKADAAPAQPAPAASAAAIAK